MKKQIISVALSSVIGITSVAVPYNAYADPEKNDNVNILGDVNGDGKVNAVDASVISVEYALLSTDGISNFTDGQNKAGDVDGDGKISAVDASYVSAYYAYLSTGGTETDMEIWRESFVLDEPITPPENVPADYSLYVNSLNILSDNAGDTTNYCLYDLDNDGTYELITENNGTKHGYSIKNGTIISVDETQVNDFVNNNSPKYYRCDDMSGLNRIMYNEPYTYYDTTDSGKDFIFNKKQYADNGTVYMGNLNLRERPTKASNAILAIPDSSRINIYGHNDEWSYVSYESGGKTYYGYAMTYYIIRESLSTTTTLPITTTMPITTTTEPLSTTTMALSTTTTPLITSTTPLITSTTPITTTTEPPITSTTDWQSAYKKTLESLASEYNFGSDSSINAMYDLVDINGNGIPELVISDGTSHANGCVVYTYTNSGYVKTTFSDSKTGFSEYGLMGVDTENHVARSYWSGMGYEYIDFYRLEGTRFVKIASFSNDEGNNGSDYKYNDVSVTKEQYKAYRSQYNYSFNTYGRQYIYTSATIMTTTTTTTMPISTTTEPLSTTTMLLSTTTEPPTTTTEPPTTTTEPPTTTTEPTTTTTEPTTTTTEPPTTTTEPPTTTTEPPTTTTEPPTTTTEPPTTTTEPTTTTTEPPTTTTEPTTTTTEPTTTTTELPITTEPPVYSYDSHGLVNAYLNLRTAPNLNADIILQMPLNSSVTITGYTDEWYKVIYQSGGNTYYGYASRSYITDVVDIDYQSAYMKTLESLTSEYSFGSNKSVDAMYDLVDINGNGIPELIISNGTAHASYCVVYTYTSNGYVKTTFSDGREVFTEYGEMGVDIENHVARSYWFGSGYQMFTFYRLEGTQFVKIASFSNDEENNGSDYQYNGNSVTKEQYKAYRSQYNYSFGAYGREKTYTSANTPYVTGNVKTYGYTIFEGSESHLYLSGNYSYVEVYLKYKNTSYDPIVYDKGQFSGSDIRISYFNAVDSSPAYLTVTPYSSSGVAGKTITCDIPTTSSGKIEPKGQINTHGGTVSGYTTNYIKNGGAVEKVRASLGNTWHVTIKQYYYNYNQKVTWYELYDSDDGDYYGWVDGNYIDFYN